MQSRSTHDAPNVSHEPQVLPPAPPPILLGRYRVMGACGTGGFGQVLTCWDTRLQRRVAIKRIPAGQPVSQPHDPGQAPPTAYAPQGAHAARARNAAPGTASASASAAAGLPATTATPAVPQAASTMAAALSEARTASLLAHPNIVGVYDFEADNSFAYLVMEYVDGITLSELLARVEGGTLTPDEACHVARSVASALAYAHDNGVLHLDIKPSNIMFSSSGAVKLCDFGMATLASAAGYGAGRGGTVGYMPPEQVAGDMVDERSDVFSLAVVLWQALTGDNPFAAATAEESAALMGRGTRRRLSETVVDATSVADDAMEAALAPDPASRTASVEALSDALAAGLMGADADAGAASLAALMAQATDDGEQDADVAAELPVAFRYPWLPGAITRCAAAAACALATAAPMHALLPAPASAALATAALAALTAAWTPAGSICAGAALLVALANPPVGAAAIMLPGLLGLLLAAWWTATARRDPHATAALLAPVALGGPAAGALVAGAYLPPARAAATALAGWAAAHLHAAAVAASFDAQATAHALAALATSGPEWISLAGAALAAAVTATVARGGRTAGPPTTPRAVAAQVVGTVVLIASQMAALAARGVRPLAPTWPTVGVAVTLCIGMCVVAALCDTGTSGEG